MKLEEALQMAWHELDRFGLTSKGWDVSFDERYRWLGHCSTSSKVIVLSQLHIEQNRPEDVRNTILHEIAHALVGRGHGHDEAWQRMARIVGAKPSAVSDCSVSRSPSANVICL